MALIAGHLAGIASTTSLPTITPAPELRARQAAAGAGTATGAIDCYNDALDNASCVDVFVSDCETVPGQSTVYYTGAAFDECECSGAAQEMTCLSNYMVAKACTTDDLDPYQPLFWQVASDYVGGFCNASVPADIVSKAHNGGSGMLTVPASTTPHPAVAATTATVSLVLVSVVDFTPSTPIAPVTHTSLPTYSGSGTLLAPHCAATSHTLLNDTETAFFAPFVGCDANRPECCPFTANDVVIGTATGGTVTLTATGTSTPSPGVLTANSGYPTPFNGAQHATLSACPDDYTDLGTACCPKGYLAFTRAVAGQTPCYSSVAVFGTTPVTLTAGVDFPYSALASGVSGLLTSASGTSTSASPTTATFPTSAVVNVVWAMQFPKSSSSSGLGAGAIAGIAVGSIAGVAILAVSAFYFLWRSRRRANAQQPQQQPQQPMQQMPPAAPQQMQPAYYAPYAPNGQPQQPQFYGAPGGPSVEPGKGGVYVHQSPSPSAQQQWGGSTSPQTVSTWTPSQVSGPDGQPLATQQPYEVPSPQPQPAEAEALQAQRHELGGA